MEGIRPTSAFTRLAAAGLAGEAFQMIDIGCLGGIDPGWRDFGPALQAVAIDCDEPEVARLSAAETNPRVRYLAGWVGIPDDHPARARNPDGVPWRRWPGGRLSYQRSNAIRQAKAQGQPAATLADYYATAINPGAPEPKGGFSTDYSAVPPYAGAGRQDGLLYIPTVLADAGLTDLDFLKIDVDGPDFDILSAMPQVLAAPGLLAVAAEVNFVGSHHATDHTFHNIDRLLRSHGFDLFNLTVRRYSSAALPWPYQDDIPALTTGGRPVQGDALYIRDLASPVNAALAAGLSDDKLLKAAGLFSLVNLPDEAAEMLLIHGERLGRRIDLAQARDLLALQIQETDQTDLGYDDYIAAFEAEAPQIMDQNGRRSVWLSGLIESGAALDAAYAEIARLKAELARERDRPAPPPAPKPGLGARIRALFS